MKGNYSIKYYFDVMLANSLEFFSDAPLSPYIKNIKGKQG